MRAIAPYLFAVALALLGVRESYRIQERQREIESLLRRRYDQQVQIFNTGSDIVVLRVVFSDTDRVVRIAPYSWETVPDPLAPDTRKETP